MTAAPLSMFADLRDRPVLVVGGGLAAARKVEALREAGARIRVGAPRLDPALRAAVSAGTLEWLPGRFEPAWLDTPAWLVVAATGDRAVDLEIARLAHAQCRPVHVVGDPAASSVHLPRAIRRGALQVAISSGGQAPAVSRHLRRWMESLLDHSWGGLVALFGHRDAAIRARHPDPSARRRFLDAQLSGPLPRLLRQRRQADAQTWLDAQLAQPTPAAHGSVTLVGAGPGDPGLLTLAALRALNEADVILHDRLVSGPVLALARQGAERIEVGKSAAGRSMHQDAIHALMLAHARAGRRVVRLKGGDPFVFGRGGEELEFLREHAIAYEVVPGITAAVACAAHAGIPLTHRDHAQSVRLVTAHCRDSLDTLDWQALARERQTLAFYMGVGALDLLQERLLAGGRGAATAFALVENGSRPEQRVVLGQLGDLAGVARRHGVASPALLILGDVAALAPSLHWFGAAPLGEPPSLPAKPGDATLAHAA